MSFTECSLCDQTLIFGKKYLIDCTLLITQKLLVQTMKLLTFKVKIRLLLLRRHHESPHKNSGLLKTNTFQFAIKLTLASLRIVTTTTAMKSFKDLNAKSAGSTLTNCRTFDNTLWKDILTKNKKSSTSFNLNLRKFVRTNLFQRKPNSKYLSKLLTVNH